MFVPKLILLLYQISIGLSFEYQKFIPTLVKDLIMVDHTPSMVITTNSWNLKIISELQRNHSIPLRFSPLTEKDNRKFQTTFLADLNTEKGIRFVRNIEKNYFRHPYRWIIIDKMNQTDEESITSKELLLLPDSNVVIVNFMDADGNCKLYQGNPKICWKKMLITFIVFPKSLQD